MKSSFIAYVDESGDEGFVFNPDGSGSSRWFVLSAAVIRQTNDLQMVSCLKEVREVLNKVPKSPLHFVDLKHEQRVPYVRRVGALPMRTVSVAGPQTAHHRTGEIPEHQISAVSVCHSLVAGTGFMALP